MENYLKRYIALNGMPKAKVDKLLHYCKRDPKKFAQYDGHIDVDPDDLMNPDTDRDSIMKGNTIELMYSAAVRVLVEPDTPKDVVIRLLRKIIDWIEKDPEATKIIDDLIGRTDLEDDDMPF